MTNDEMLRATNNGDLIQPKKATNVVEAIQVLNDVIRVLNKEYHEEKRFSSADLADELNEVRQFLGGDL